MVNGTPKRYLQDRYLQGPVAVGVGVRHAQAVADYLTGAAEAWAQVDVLVNNAGGSDAARGWRRQPYGRYLP
ncbi:MAG: hypothetical protein ACYCS7_00200 [Acidimicrobiales bacterium]